MFDAIGLFRSDSDATIKKEILKDQATGYILGYSSYRHSIFCSFLDRAFTGIKIALAIAAV